MRRTIVRKHFFAKKFSLEIEIKSSDTKDETEEVLEKTVITFKTDNPKTIAEVGGHQFAAGCLIEKEKETEFVEALKKELEIEIVKI